MIEAFLNNNFSSPTHWPDWNIIISKYYNTKFYYFAAYKNDKLIGLCPVHETNTTWLKTLYSGQFHFIPNGGWIFSDKTEVTEQFYPIPATRMFQGFSLPLIAQFNAIYNFKNQKKFWTLLIDLKKDLDEIWKNDLNTKRRNMIRKAEKYSIKIINDDKTDLREFYKYYTKANQKNKLQSLPLDFFIELFASSKNVHSDILWAENDKVKIATVVTVYDRNYSFYWLGIPIENTPNLGQGELLQWEAIKRTKEYGCKYYDLCYIQKEKLPHIYKFKKGFSKTKVPNILHTKKSFIYRALNKIKKYLNATWVL